MTRRWLWLLPLFAILFLALLAYGLTRDPYVLPSPLAGEAAPPFRLEALDGDTIALADLRGTPVVLNFWASWCLPCRDEHPVLTRIDAKYEGRVRVVGVVYQDSRAAARVYLSELGGDWPNLIDPGSRVAIDYGVYGPPETFFIAADGRIAAKRIGPITWRYASARLDSLLAPTDAGSVAGGTGGAARAR